MDRDQDQRQSIPNDEPAQENTWTQAKSEEAVPDANPEQFAEFEDDREPRSVNKAEVSGEPVIPEHAEPPSKAAGKDENAQG